MKYLLIAIVLFTHLDGIAKYGHLPLHEMIARADEIVWGTITEVTDEVFNIEVEGSISGEFEYITIQRFQNWTCAARWTEYQIGQKSLFFLRRNEDKYEVLGSGNDGELPIMESKVYLYHLSVPLPDNESREEIDSTIKRYNVYGGSFYGYMTDLETLLKFVVELRNCVVLSKVNMRIVGWTADCNKTELVKLSHNSRLVAWTLESLPIYWKSIKNER